MTTIVWFRDDLRLADNPALAWAAERGDVIALYIYDDATEGLRALGGAQRWWLRQSLDALDRSLRGLGGKLLIKKGQPLDVLDRVIAENGVSAVCWNRLYSQPAITRDTAIKQSLKQRQLAVQTFNANLIHEPLEVKNLSGGNFKVFTPFWKNISAAPVHHPTPVPNLNFKPTSDALTPQTCPSHQLPSTGHKGGTTCIDLGKKVRSSSCNPDWTQFSTAMERIVIFRALKAPVG